MPGKCVGAAVFMVLLAGCTSPTITDPFSANESGAAPPLFPLRLTLEDDQDLVLSVNITGDGDVPFEVSFANTTPLPDVKAWSWSMWGMAHDKYDTIGRTRLWNDRETVAVTLMGTDVGAGPAFDPLMADLLWGNVYTGTNWTEMVPPGHYHFLIGVESASADVVLSVPRSADGRINAFIMALGADAIDVRNSLDPSAYDETTQVYTPRLGVVDVHEGFDIDHPFNRVGVFIPGPFYWTLAGNGIQCGSLNSYPTLYQGGAIFNLPRGSYQFDATGAGDYPYVWFTTLQVPGHEDIGSGVESGTCEAT